MLRTDVADDIDERVGESWGLRPDYGGYCFGHLSETVTETMGAHGGRTLPDDVFGDLATGVDTVVVVLVDSYGYEFWARDRGRHSMLDKLTEQGRVTPLTSVYPSETAAAINTYQTGALPAEHGVTAWNVYDPELDISFAALPREVKTGGTATDLHAARVVAADPIEARLADAGVDCHHVLPFPSHSETATTHRYDAADLSTLASPLTAAIDESGDPGYVYAYLPQVDSTAHEYGVDAPEFHESAGRCFEQVERVVSGVSEGAAEDTLLVVTADHGHTGVDPDASVALDDVPGLTDALRTHGDGTPVRMAGSPRNVHLHLQADADPEGVAAAVTDLVDATVFSREEVLEMELFGDVAPSETFRRRLPDLVVCPRDVGLWWRAEEGELKNRGMHGGPSRREMLTQVAVARLSSLR